MAREHGTRSKYVTDKCRCDLCRKANTAYYHKDKYNQAPKFVKASRTRKHIAELRAAGVGKRAIANTAQVSLSAIMKIAAGQVLQIRPETEAAICGVTARAVADHGYVPIARTLEHIELLVAKGWTRKNIANAIGTGRERALQMPKDRIVAWRARAIEALLDLPAPINYDRWGNAVEAKPAEITAARQPVIPVDVALPTMIDEGDMSWMARGACRVNATPTWVFFPGRGDQKVMEAAKAVCATCSVSSDCLDYAQRTAQHVGIWGGLSERQRRDLRAKTTTAKCVRCTSVYPKNAQRTLCDHCYAVHRKAKRNEYSRQASLRTTAVAS
jgi:WhiB family redox-sensing transcriptional regulator